MHTPRRIAAVAGALSFLVATPALAGFSDVPSSHRYADAIGYVEAQGIVSGYADGTYKPGALVNRAEFTKIVTSALFTETEREDLLARVRLRMMSDVPSDAWFAHFVFFASAKGLIDGYPDGTFKPAQTINFAEAAKIVVKAYNLPFKQDQFVWYKGYIDALAEVNGIPTEVTDPNGLLTRGQLADMIYRLRHKATDEPPASHSSSSAKGQSSSVRRDEPSSPSTGGENVYRSYTDGVIGADERVMLFFYAGWNRTCQGNDKMLKEWYANNKVVMPTYRVDYDSETELREKYDVLHVNTFVLVDGDGKVLRFMDAPTQTNVQAIISGSVDL